MATAQMQRPKVANDSWSKVLPNPTVSRTQSEQFVKKLVALGVSNVTYLRALFPEDVYVNRELEGVRLKILRDDGTCDAATKLIAWLKGAFDAFSKKYLRQLILAIHAFGAAPDDALETYTFHFSYKGEDVSSCSFQREINSSSEKFSTEMNCSLKEIRRNTLEMLRTTVQLTQSLPVLPNKCGVSIRLLYYDEVTPNDYEPPGYYSIESPSFTFASDSLNLKIGQVHTPFHGIKFNARLEEKVFSHRQEENVPQDDQMSVSSSRIAQSTRNGDFNYTTNSEDIIDNSQTLQKGIRQPEEDMIVPSASPAAPESGDIASGPMYVEATKTPSSVREAGIRCTCGMEKDGGLMIRCTFCNKWQHGACYGILNENLVPTSHVCIGCHVPGKKEQQCTDVKLLPLSTQQRQEICLYRRTLRCIELCRVDPPFLQQELDVSADIALLLFLQLDKDGVLRQGKKLPRTVNMKTLKSEVLPLYFGPEADLSKHVYTFKFDDPVDTSAKDLNALAITPRSSTRNRKRRSLNMMDYEFLDEDISVRKKQKVSEGIKHKGLIN